jgi:hypothetical protein
MNKAVFWIDIMKRQSIVNKIAIDNASVTDIRPEGTGLFFFSSVH